MSADRIPLARPALGEAELAAVRAVIGSGRLVNGPRAEQFEDMLAKLCGRRHAVAVASGTSALELSFWALEIGPGDEVLIPAFVFPAAAHAVVARGATPVPVDVDAGDWNLDPAAARAAVTEHTRACVGIDQFGLVTESAPLEQLARDAGLRIIGDSACAIGGSNSTGVAGGGYGALSILSFHPRKLVTTGEGGCVLTDDDDLAAAVRQLRNLGQAGPGQFARIGTNARLSEIEAAIGCVQLGRLDALLAERRLLADGYLERLAPLANSGRISPQHVPAGALHSYQTFVVLLAQGVDRDAVRAALHRADIESGPGTYAFTRLEPFSAFARPMPVSDALHDRSLALPLYSGMRSGELDRVAVALTEALASSETLA